MAVETKLPMPGVLSVAQVRDLIAYIKTFRNDRILECLGPRDMSCMEAFLEKRDKYFQQCNCMSSNYMGPSDLYLNGSLLATRLN